MRVIAFVGADGCGKTTQAKLLASRMESIGLRVKCVRPSFALLDPWKAGGSLAYTLSPRRRKVADDSNLLTRSVFQIVGILYALASYARIATTGIRYDFVVCDRYFVQYFFDLFGREQALKILKVFPRPDYTIWLDMDSGEVIQRNLERNSLESHGRYLREVMSFYEDAHRALNFNRIVVESDPSSTAMKIWNAVGREVSLREVC